MSKYILYNQKIESDIALDIFGVEKAEFDDPDITVTLQQSYKPSQKTKKIYEIKKNGGFFFKENVALYEIASSSLINVYPHDLATDYKLAQTLLNFPFAIILNTKNFTVLHGSAIEFNGKLMLFVGASHSGKSTLANFFLSKGAELYSEDICVLRNNDHFILPSQPYIKLSIDSYKSTHYSLERTNIEEDEERVGYTVHRGNLKSIKPDICFFLEWSSSNAIQNINNDEKIRYLYKFAYLSNSINDSAKVLRILNQIHIKKLFVKKDLDNINKVFKLVNEFIISK